MSLVFILFPCLLLLLCITTASNAFLLNTIGKRGLALRAIEDDARRKEIAQQKQEAANSFIQFNDAQWSGTATIVDVDMLLGGREIVGLPAITTGDYSLSSETEIGGKGIQQFNTLQWKNEDGGVSFSRYTSKLSNPTGGFDVDAVDGSYSTDHTLLDLNLPGADKNVIGTFAIETSIAVEDDRRLRSMLIYGFSRKLNRIVLFDERRDKEEGGGASIQEQVLSKVEDMENPSDRMLEIQKAAAAGARKAKTEAAAVEQKEGEEKVSVKTFPPPLRRICGGTWVGDGVIRNNSAEWGQKLGSRRKRNGFGEIETTKKMSAGAGMNDGFAEWIVNVFKSNLSYQWDGDKQLRSEASIGIGLGTTTDSDTQPLMMVSWGDLTVEGRVEVGRGSAWKDKESMNVGVWDDGEVISLQIGCVMVKGGLSLKGDEVEERGQGEQGGVLPFSSEMNVFQVREQGGEGGEKEYFLSKLGRLYGKEGILKSGSSAFYALKPFFVDE